MTAAGFPFDTLATRKRLIDAGFSDRQADTLAEVGSEAARDVLATKADLGQFRQEIAADMTTLRRDIAADMATLRRDIAAEMAALRHDMTAEMASLRHDMDRMGDRLTIRLGGIVIASVGIAVAVLRFGIVS